MHISYQNLAQHTCHTCRLTASYWASSEGGRGQEAASFTAVRSPLPDQSLDQSGLCTYVELLL